MAYTFRFWCIAAVLVVTSPAAAADTLGSTVECYNAYARRFGSATRVPALFQIHPQDQTIFAPVLSRDKRGILAANASGAVFQDASVAANESAYFKINRPNLPPNTEEHAYTWWLEMRVPGSEKSSYAELSHWEVSNEVWIQFWIPEKNASTDRKLNYLSASRQKTVSADEALDLIQPRIRAMISGTFDLAHGRGGLETTSSTCPHLMKLLGELKSVCQFAVKEIDSEMQRFAADEHCRAPSKSTTAPSAPARRPKAPRATAGK